MFWYDYYNGNELLDGTFCKFTYALACLIMWFKLYNLMRIFTDYAHFITTINEIVKEIRVFVVITFIIILAFANLFYVLSDKSKGRYIQNFFG